MVCWWARHVFAPRCFPSVGGLSTIRRVLVSRLSTRGPLAHERRITHAAPSAYSAPSGARGGCRCLFRLLYCRANRGMHHFDDDWRRSRRPHVFSDVGCGRSPVRCSHHGFSSVCSTAERSASAALSCSALAASFGSVRIGNRVVMASCRGSSFSGSARRRRRYRTGVPSPLGSDFDRLVFATSFVPPFSCSVCTAEGLTSRWSRPAFPLMGQQKTAARWPSAITALAL